MWKDKQASLSAFAHHATTYLAIPVTSVPAEQLFSRHDALLK